VLDLGEKGSGAVFSAANGTPNRCAPYCRRLWFLA